jgi:hypothetical protein
MDVPQELQAFLRGRRLQAVEKTGNYSRVTGITSASSPVVVNIAEAGCIDCLILAVYRGRFIIVLVSQTPQREAKFHFNQLH